ncbi:MAG: ABC transporter ATP-binding protein [Sulfolobales archaeon]
MISLEEVSFYYTRDRYILKDLSIEFPSDKISVILGPNGVGKTTLLKIIAGILRPVKGSVKIHGRSPWEMRGRIGYIPQGSGLYPWMRVRDNIELPLKILGESRVNREKIVYEIAEKLGIGELLDRYPRELSGGESQKVAISRILVSRSEVLLMDEPLSMIDLRSRRELIDLIRKLNRDLRTTTLMVTHNIEDAVELGDLIYIVGDRPLKIIEVYDKNNYDVRDLYSRIVRILDSGFRVV